MCVFFFIVRRPPSASRTDTRFPSSTLVRSANKKVKSIDPSVLQASSPDEIPDALRKRYFSTTSKWSGEPAYFTSAQAKEPAFLDQGRRLITSSESDEVVRDLVAIARHRGWSHVQDRKSTRLNSRH